MDEARERMLETYDRSKFSEQPLSWFEDLYRTSKGDRDLVPWDWRGPHPFLEDWESTNKITGRALVVGSGLGEDAAFLHEKGWEVTAFDLSETAISWAAKLHPNMDIDWVVGDILHPDERWMGAFDLVLEVHILQAIPEEPRKIAYRNLAPLLAQNGLLVCIGRLSGDSEKEDQHPPWPLSREFVLQIGKDLEEVEFHIAKIPQKEAIRYRAVWRQK